MSRCLAERSPSNAPGIARLACVAAITSALTAAPWGGGTARGAAPQMRCDENPFAAHNAYPWRIYQPGRFERAIDAGLKHLEIDITYDPERQAAVATHDAKPSGSEPALAEMIDRLFAKWTSAGGQGYTLILDFKSASLELVRAVQAILDQHRDTLSWLDRRDGSFHAGAVTVCFTGNTAAHRLYAEEIAGDGCYRGFGDRGAEGWLDDASEYVPAEPAGFVRFLTFERRVFQDTKGATGEGRISSIRLQTVVDLANQRGYRIRIYTINPPKGADGRLNTVAWQRAVEAGVHMIATDAYEHARDWWAEYCAN